MLATMSKRVNWSGLPVTMPNGAMMPAMSARMRTELVDGAFYEIGGPAAFADWARENKSDFYKMWGRGAVHSASVELHADESIEAILDRLDAGEHAKVVSPDAE